MNYAGFGYPATVSTGFSKAVPTYSKAVAPYGKGFGGFGKGLGGYGKGFGKPFGKVGYGFPATKASGFSTAVPVTSVATTPFPGVI